MKARVKATGDIVNVELKCFGDFSSYVSDEGVMYNGLYDLDFDIDVDMKARVKETGEVVELADDCFLYDKDYKHSYYADELKSLEFDYWEKLKHQYAGMAMQGLLSNHVFFKDVDHVTNGKPEDMVTTIANSLATALVEKLKGE